MNLEEYLKKLKKCSDKQWINEGVHKTQLSVECGVCDNWPILLKVDYDTLLTQILGLAPIKYFRGRYKFCGGGTEFNKVNPDLKKKDPSNPFDESQIEFNGKFSSVKNPITERKVQAALSILYGEEVDKPSIRIRNDFDYVPGCVTMQINTPSHPQTYRVEQHTSRQKNFDVLILLHPYRDEGKFSFAQERRMIARVIEDFGRYAIKNNIPLCFPRANLENWDDKENLDDKLIYFNA